MSDTWETGVDTDITEKPRALSPLTIRKIYKINTPETQQQDDEDENVFRPTFTCLLPANVEPNKDIKIIPVKGVPPEAEYTLSKQTWKDGKDVFEFWILTIKFNNRAQCKFELTDEPTSDSNKRIFGAYSYTWLDDSRIMHQYTDPFTNLKEYGWGPSLYGDILFGHEWKKMELKF